MVPIILPIGKVNRYVCPTCKQKLQEASLPSKQAIEAYLERTERGNEGLFVTLVIIVGLILAIIAFLAH